MAVEKKRISQICVFQARRSILLASANMHLRCNFKHLQCGFMFLIVPAYTEITNVIHIASSGIIILNARISSHPKCVSCDKRKSGLRPDDIWSDLQYIPYFKLMNLLYYEINAKQINAHDKSGNEHGIVVIIADICICTIYVWQLARFDLRLDHFHKPIAN